MVTSHGGASFWLLPKRRKINYIYIYTCIYIHRISILNKIKEKEKK